MGNSSNFGVLIRRCWSIVGLALLSIFVQFNLAAIVAVIGKEYSFGIQRFLGGKPLPVLTEWVIPFISTYDGELALYFFTPSAAVMVALTVYCITFRWDNLTQSFLIGLAYYWLITIGYYTILFLGAVLPFVSTLVRLSAEETSPPTNWVALGMHSVAWLFVALTVAFVIIGIRRNRNR